MTSRYVTIPSLSDMQSAMIRHMQSVLTLWRADESDPGVYWADLTVNEMRKWANEFNAGADNNFVPTAVGQALVDLVSEVGITATVDEATENPLAVRQQYYDAFVALAKDTPEYARFLARLVSSDVVDVGLVSQRTLNLIDMYLANADGDDPGSTVRAAVEARMNLPTNHPIWLNYRVLPSTKTDFTVTAEVTYRKGQPSPESVVLVNLNAALIALRKLDTEINHDTLKNGMWADDVVSITVTSPAATLAKSASVVYNGMVDTITFVEQA